MKSGFYADIDLVWKSEKKTFIQPFSEMYGETLPLLNKEVKWFEKHLKDKQDNRKVRVNKVFQVIELDTF